MDSSRRGFIAQNGCWLLASVSPSYCIGIPTVHHSLSVRREKAGAPKSQHRDRTHARTDTQRQTHQAQDTADTQTADTHTSAESQPPHILWVLRTKVGTTRHQHPTTLISTARGEMRRLENLPVASCQT